MRKAALVAGLLAACGPPVSETVAGAQPDGTLWHLISLDGTPPIAPLTLSFRKDGGVSGSAPCNRFSAAQRAPLPWFALGPILSTKRACPDLDAEQRYLSALAEMRQAEVQAGTLVLTGSGRDMVFEAR